MLREREVVNWVAKERPRLGFAADLGTTKVAGYLVDLSDGRVLASRGAMNPQISYGEDVMARISYAMESAEHEATLNRLVRQAVDEMVAAMCVEVGARPEDVVDAAIVGNTAMITCLWDCPCASWGCAIRGCCERCDRRQRQGPGDQFGARRLRTSPAQYRRLCGSGSRSHASGHRHASDGRSRSWPGHRHEHRSGASGQRTSPNLLHGLGPAFEGAHIRDGMRASEGAIERVLLQDGRIKYQTIGEVPPIGLCGSGILDAVAQLRKEGIVDRRGAIQLAHPRVRETEKGREFVLVDREDSASGREIVVTRGDIGEIQLAKGAMRAGLNILLEKAGLEESALDQVVIAGAFGSYIDVDSAVSIGMFPRLPLDRFVQVGNAAGMGARMALVSWEQRREAVRIAARAEYVELTNTPEFTEAFALAMFLS